MNKPNLDKNTLRKFGITMAACLAIIALIITLKGRHNPLPACFISVLFLLVTFIMPVLLSLVYIGWMRLGYVLGWVNSRIILSIIFYFVFTPMGLVMKLFGSDLLGLKIDKNTKSYWLKKENKGLDISSYERQF